MLLALALPLLAREMAITIDDLPMQGRGGHPAESVSVTTDRILAALRGVPATGFVNCAWADVATMRRWLDAGMTLGNHAASHMDLSAHEPGTWLEDVRRCDRWLRDELGIAPAFFRYPYLHQGDTPEKRDAAAAGLTAMGYRVAHVTVDNSEWRLASAYARALGDGDAVTASAVAADYVAHVVDAARHYDAVARAKLGREIPHVLLLHANALAADHLGAALDALRADGWSFVPLETALADPAYALPDAYAGRAGISWIYRVEPRSEDDGAWDERTDRAIREKYPR